MLPILIVVSVCVDKMTGGFQVPVSGDLGGRGQGRSCLSYIWQSPPRLARGQREFEAAFAPSQLDRTYLVPTSYLTFPA